MTTTTAPDLTQSATYLEALAPGETSFHFVTLDDVVSADGKKRNSPQLRADFKGTLAQHAETLARMNRQGAGVFVVVNATDGAGRAAHNVTGVRAVWHDHDDPAAPRPVFPEPPVLVVQTSPGKTQSIWPVAGGLSFEEHAAMLDVLVERYGSDAGAKGRNRVLRLPGFDHMKGAPHRVSIIEDGSFFGAVPADLMRRQFLPNGVPPRPALASHPIGETDHARLKSALARIEAEARETWRDVGMGLHAEASGGAEAKALWDEWSQTCPDKYDPDEQDRAWASFKSRGDGVTAGTIFRLAQAAGWSDPAKTEGFAPILEAPPAPPKPVGHNLKFPRQISLAAHRERHRNALVRGLVNPGDTGMLYGDSGAGKTFLGLDLAFHIALGRPWSGRRVTQAPVLYCALEGALGFELRVLAATQAMSDPGDFLAMYQARVSMVRGEVGEASVAEVAKAADDLRTISGVRCGLIVVDTLARAMAGDDENSTQDMTHFIEHRAQKLASLTGAAVMIVHHKNKGGEVRGNSALYGACDFVLEAQRDKSGNRALFAKKVKDGEEGPLFDYGFKSVHLDGDMNDPDDRINSCVVELKAPELKTTAPPILTPDMVETAAVLAVLAAVPAGEAETRAAPLIRALYASDASMRRSDETLSAMLRRVVDGGETGWVGHWEGKTGGTLTRKSS